MSRTTTKRREQRQNAPYVQVDKKIASVKDCTPERPQRVSLEIRWGALSAHDTMTHLILQLHGYSPESQANSCKFANDITISPGHITKILTYRGRMISEMPEQRDRNCVAEPRRLLFDCAGYRIAFVQLTVFGKYFQSFNDA